MLEIKFFLLCDQAIVFTLLKKINNITSVRASPIRALCSLFSDSSPIFSDIAAAFRSASVAAAVLEMFWLTFDS